MPLKSCKKLVLLAIAPLLVLTPAAAENLALRPEAKVSGDTVRLGDLVTGAGDKAGIALFRAPELGRIGTIRTESIRKAAEELGLPGLVTNGLKAVLVSRAARQASPDEVAGAVRAALLRLDASLADAAVDFDSPPLGLDLPPNASLAVEPVNFDMEQGRFTVKIAQSDAAVTLSGTIRTMIEVPVLTRAVSRGDVISSADVVLEPRPRRSLPSGLLMDSARLTSLIARRPLKAGETIRETDLASRDLVERNQKVTVSYDSPGINLTLAAKALAAGPAGAVVPVQNLTSKRTFDAVVTGPGAVSAKLTP